jgi:hypothetical protein
MKPTQIANKPILAGKVLEHRVFKLCDSGPDAYKA